MDHWRRWSLSCSEGVRIEGVTREAEACHHVAESESLKTDRERLLVQGQPRLQRKSQDAGDTRNVGVCQGLDMRSRAGVSL